MSSGSMGVGEMQLGTNRGDRSIDVVFFWGGVVVGKEGTPSPNDSPRLEARSLAKDDVGWHGSRSIFLLMFSKRRGRRVYCSVNYVCLLDAELEGHLAEVVAVEGGSGRGQEGRGGRDEGRREARSAEVVVVS